MLFRFLGLRTLVLVPMGRQLSWGTPSLRPGCCHRGRAQGRELQRKRMWNGRRGGKGIRVIQNRRQRVVFSDRREVKISSGGEQVHLFQSEDTKQTESRSARAIRNYFPVQGRAQGEASSKKMHRGAGGVLSEVAQSPFLVIAIMLWRLAVSKRSIW